jgi:hypothetical protein
MTKNVFAGKWEIAAENGMNKSIARFPDVCMSPPSPPAGPIPIPYPNTSFSNNLKSGSSTVKIGGKGAALAQKSYYKEPVLGNEAATRTFGAAIITHQITGKTYFQSWCMDVKFEGKNVCRHLDMTTSNHASYPGSTPPNLSAETQAAIQTALDRLEQGVCPCCGKSDCAAAQGSVPTDTGGNAYKVEIVTGADAKKKALSFNEFYRLDDPAPPGSTRAAKIASLKCMDPRCVNAGKPHPPKSDPPCDVYRVIDGPRKDAIDNDYEGPDNSDTVKKLKDDMGVPKTADDILEAVGDFDFAGLAQNFPSVKKAFDKNPGTKHRQLDHTTPRSAGGCPTSPNNLVPAVFKCNNCSALDGELDGWANDEIRRRRP